MDDHAMQQWPRAWAHGVAMHSLTRACIREHAFPTGDAPHYTANYAMKDFVVKKIIAKEAPAAEEIVSYEYGIDKMNAWCDDADKLLDYLANHGCDHVNACERECMIHVRSCLCAGGKLTKTAPSRGVTRRLSPPKS